MTTPTVCAPAADALLDAAGLYCRFSGVMAVADLSFSVRAGEIKAVIGPNGAGKTTLFNMIAGVTRPTAGRITVASRRIERLPAWRRAGLGIARTFQNLQLFRDLTVLENVMVGRHAQSHAGLLRAVLRSRRTRAEERAIAASAMALLERVGLARRAAEPAGALSFGEGKCLELARALATAPRLLLLDEPAAGLPQAEAERMAALIAALNRDGLTVLLVEHNMRMVMALSHDILVLSNGRRIAEGSPAAIRGNPQVISAYLGVDDDD